MMHPYTNEMFSFDDLIPSGYIIKENASWNKKGVALNYVEVNPPNRVARIYLLPGAFWSDDSFEAGDHVLLLVHKTAKTRAGSLIAGAILSEASAERFFISGDIEASIDRIEEFFSLPSNLQRLAYTFIQNRESSSIKDELTIEFNMADPTSNTLEYFNVIKSNLLPEQRMACKRWLMRSSKPNEAKKLDTFLSICPATLSKQTEPVSYEEILAVLNKEIIGCDPINKTVAKALAERRKKHRRRGIRILFYGLSGTGKTSWGKAISNALKLPYTRVNLGEISSTVSILGCESSYENSDIGSIAKFLRSVCTSEVLIVWDQVDKLARPGTERGKDGNVAESLLGVLDPDSPCLCDNFLDNVPIDCGNMVSILTANRKDNIPAEFINRCDLVIEVKPFSEETLTKIMDQRATIIGRESGLANDWISTNAKAELLRYRGDFGARDIRAALCHMADIAKDTKCKVTRALVEKEMTKTVQMDDPAIWFHYHEHLYTNTQREAILNAFNKRIGSENLSAIEKRALDLKIKYLTRLIPDGLHTFNVDQFYTEANKLYGMMSAKNAIAAELYAGNFSIENRSDPILFVGPPGVGKTSLVEAIAVATNRKYIRLQMNGVTEASFINGNSPEKVAADAGQPVRKMTQAETTSPLMYFDEIEKVSAACAISMIDLFDDSGLFFDHFLEETIDLSGAMLIASCNDLSAMNPVLLSRFKVIHVPGYSTREKQTICREYLIPSAAKGMDVSVSEDAVMSLVKRYANEAGIRGIKHGLQSVIKQTLLARREDYKAGTLTINQRDVEQVLGRASFSYIADHTEPGSLNALGTMGDSAGIVMPIRVTLLDNGTRRITGLPEGAIRDSILIAETWLEGLGYSLEKGFHIHFGPGGIKKDGPSAGLAIAVALYSAVTGMAVPKVAFTGEFDGCRVLPVGGLDLKIQAAQTAECDAVFLPEGCRNKVDSKKFDIKILFASTIKEVIDVVFSGNQSVRSR